MPPEPLHANLELVPVSPIYHYIWQNVMASVKVPLRRPSYPLSVGIKDKIKRYLYER